MITRGSEGPGFVLYGGNCGVTELYRSRIVEDMVAVGNRRTVLPTWGESFVCRSVRVCVVYVLCMCVVCVCVCVRCKFKGAVAM